MKEIDEKTVGILGGMGPLATADLFKKIILHTKAGSDNEHIHLFIDSNSKIPDRTEYIMGRGPSPLNEMVKSALRLEMMGADIIVMPCNTAHFFYDEIKRFIGCDFINMIEETALYVKKTLKVGGKAALLATEGTCRAGVYDRIFEKYGISLIKPDRENQDIVTGVIYGVKKGEFPPYSQSLEKSMSDLKEKGADLFILGCTELPVYFEAEKINEAFADPTDILALAAVEKAGRETI